MDKSKVMPVSNFEIREAAGQIDSDDIREALFGAMLPSLLALMWAMVIFLPSSKVSSWVDFSSRLWYVISVLVLGTLIMAGIIFGLLKLTWKNKILKTQVILILAFCGLWLLFEALIAWPFRPMSLVELVAQWVAGKTGEIDALSARREIISYLGTSLWIGLVAAGVFLVGLWIAATVCFVLKHIKNKNQRQSNTTDKSGKDLQGYCRAFLECSGLAVIAALTSFIILSDVVVDLPFSWKALFSALAAGILCLVWRFIYLFAADTESIRLTKKYADNPVFVRRMERASAAYHKEESLLVSIPQKCYNPMLLELVGSHVFLPDYPDPYHCPNSKHRQFWVNVHAIKTYEKLKRDGETVPLTPWKAEARGRKRKKSSSLKGRLRFWRSKK